MKIEIGKDFPQYFKPAYPEEFDLFSHFEVTAGIPTVLFAVTTWKENGKPNVCFHSWSCFHGDKTAFFAVMGNLYQHTHTYANIQREKCFCINFLPVSCYDNLVNTIHQNEWDDDEFAAGGFTVSNAKTIHAPAINEAFLTMECTLKEIQDLSGEKTDLCCLCLHRRTLLPESRTSRRLLPCILRNTTDLRRERCIWIFLFMMHLIQPR